MPIDNIIDWYEARKQEREEYLTYAEETAEVTLPTLMPKGTKIQRLPFTSIGTQAVLSLASSMHRVLMPPQVQWYNLNLDSEVVNAIMARPEGNAIVAQLQDGISAIDHEIVAELNTMMARSRMGSGIRRNLVEGNTGVGIFRRENENDNLDIVLYPLRNIICEREGGRLVRAAFREEEDRTKNPPPRVEGSPETRKYIYRFVDYEEGYVLEQHTDDKKPSEVDMVPAQFFVMVPEIPDVANYATPYAYHYKGQIREADMLAANFVQITARLAWFIPVLSQAAVAGGWTPEKIQSLKVGEPLVGSPEWMNFITDERAIGDLTAITGARAVVREELTKAFAIGLSERLWRSNVTATAVVEMAEEVASHTHDLMSAAESTMQRPLVEAVLAALDQEKVLIDKSGNLKGGVKLTITTGQSAVQKSQALTNMIQNAQVIKQSLDLSLRTNGSKLLHQIAKNSNYPTEGSFSEIWPEVSAEEQAAMEQQMIAQAQAAEQGAAA